MGKEEEYDANGARGGCRNGEKGRDGVRACRSRSVPASLAAWWTPFGLFFFLLQVKVRPHLSLFLSVSQSLSLSLSFSRSLAFFPLFLRKSSATKEEGYLPFYQTAASYLEHSHPRPTCGWLGITTGERLPRTLAATLKPYRATRFSCVTSRD